jgi:hypothetical protein
MPEAPEIPPAYSPWITIKKSALRLAEGAGVVAALAVLDYLQGSEYVKNLSPVVLPVAMAGFAGARNWFKNRQKELGE